jgi:hypothetical protein
LETNEKAAEGPRPGNETELLARLGRGADGGWLGAFKHRVRTSTAHIENDQRDGSAHENDSRPCGEPSENVGGSAGAEGSLRTLSAEGTGEVSRTALLEQDNTDQKEAHNDVHNDHEVEEDIHFLSGFPSLPGRTGLKIDGAEEGT